MKTNILISLLAVFAIINSSATGNDRAHAGKNKLLSDVQKDKKVVKNMSKAPKPSKQNLLPPEWNPKLAGDEVMKRLINVTASQVKGAHDAEFVCVGERAYIVEHDNDVEPGHNARTKEIHGAYQFASFYLQASIGVFVARQTWQN